MKKTVFLMLALAALLAGCEKSEKEDEVVKNTP